MSKIKADCAIGHIESIYGPSMSSVRRQSWERVKELAELGAADEQMGVRQKLADCITVLRSLADEYERHGTWLDERDCNNVIVSTLREIANDPEVLVLITPSA